MTNLQTCYSISTRLIFWGEHLKHQQLAGLLGLDASSINTEKKGELIKLSSSGKSRTPKTGLMSASFQNSKNCFDPMEQLDVVGEKLNRASVDELRNCGVERGELQLSVFYEKENPSDAERDFSVPNRLIQALAKTEIQLRVTVMP